MECCATLCATSVERGFLLTTFKTFIWTLLHRVECWAMTKSKEAKAHVARMQMVRWMSAGIRKLELEISTEEINRSPV